MPTTPKIIGTPYHGTHTLGNWESDNAYDFATPVGTPLYAAFSGTIGQQIGALVDSASSRFAGLRLHLVGAANELYYAHLSRIVVKPGEQVQKGQLVGYSGSASGVAHLHLGARTGDDRAYAGTIFGVGAKDTGAGATGPTAQQSANWGNWAAAFLKALGVPESKANMQFVVGWLRAENPSSTFTWNPLATTLKTKSSLRQGGVQAYANEQAGLAATVQTIQSGQYGAIRRALAAGTSSQATWDALRASPWDAGHYSATPKVPYHASDLINPVVGSKKGSGGLDVSGVAGDVFGLAGVSGLDLAGGAKDAVTGAAGGVEGAISGAASAVGGAIESTAIRVGYILVGLLLGGAALVLVVRTVGGPSLPSVGGSDAPASAAGGTAAAAEGAAEALAA